MIICVFYCILNCLRTLSLCPFFLGDFCKISLFKNKKKKRKSSSWSSCLQAFLVDLTYWSSCLQAFLVDLTSWSHHLFKPFLAGFFFLVSNPLLWAIICSLTCVANLYWNIRSARSEALSAMLEQQEQTLIWSVKISKSLKPFVRKIKEIVGKLCRIFNWQVNQLRSITIIY